MGWMGEWHLHLSKASTQSGSSMRGRLHDTHLGVCHRAERVASADAVCARRQRAAAVLPEQPQGAVEQVADAVGQVGIDDVAKALLREVAVLHGQRMRTAQPRVRCVKDAVQRMQAVTFCTCTVGWTLAAGP